MKSKNRIDLRVDPPPDLAVEIDGTHASLPKLPILAEFGASEVWRYDGDRFQIWTLREGEYASTAQSGILTGITAEAISILLREGEAEGLTGISWIRRVRSWVQSRG
jgi:Uma2 family endonuclease